MRNLKKEIKEMIDGILPVIRESVKYIFLLTTNTIGILQ